MRQRSSWHSRQRPAARLAGLLACVCLLRTAAGAALSPKYTSIGRFPYTDTAALSGVRPCSTDAVPDTCSDLIQLSQGILHEQPSTHNSMSRVASAPGCDALLPCLTRQMDPCPASGSTLHRPHSCWHACGASDGLMVTPMSSHRSRSCTQMHRFQQVARDSLWY